MVSGKIRLALMLPGAASLGAYEGGALAAILLALQEGGGSIVVDAMATASAGSITGLIACRALFGGADPVDLMRATWVDMPSLGNLKTHKPDAPLTMEKLRSTAKRLLDRNGPVPNRDNVHRQGDSVRLSMALTVLGGLTYRLADLGDPQAAISSVEAQTYLDWFMVTFGPDSPQERLVAAIDGALASGSTPIGFTPRFLRRDDDETRKGYAKSGIIDPPETMWCSDGGDIDNAPFGRLLDLIGSAPCGPDDERFIVMLQMEPAHVTVGGKWFDSDSSKVPTWTSTLLRVEQIRQSQSIYEDLRRLEKTNARIGWIDMVAQHLGEALETVDDAEVKDRVVTALEMASRKIDRDENRIRSEIRLVVKPEMATSVESESGETSAADTDLTELLVDVLERAAGFSGKQQIKVEIVAPDPSKGPAASQLAGAFLGHFGGFFDVAFRMSDFALGFENACDWLERFLPIHIEGATEIVDQVRSRYADLGWSPDRGGAGPSDLSLKERLAAVCLLGHVVHVLEHGIRQDVGLRL